jgi:hypothetical protein
MSRPPKADRARLTIPSAALGLVMSAVMASALPPASRTRAAAAATFSSLRETISTLAPDLASAVATASPRPCPPPVTRATFSASSFAMMEVGIRANGGEEVNSLQDAPHNRARRRRPSS